LSISNLRRLPQYKPRQRLLHLPDNTDGGLEHKQINASKKKRVIKKIYHVQHVNSYQGRLKVWLNKHFNGVATKYMDNYLFWSRFLELNKSLDKVELKRTLLTQVLATNKATTVNSLRLKTIA
jgi:hypothetical protein